MKVRFLFLSAAAFSLLASHTSAAAAPAPNARLTDAASNPFAHHDVVEVMRRAADYQIAEQATTQDHGWIRSTDLERAHFNFPGTGHDKLQWLREYSREVVSLYPSTWSQL